MLFWQALKLSPRSNRNKTSKNFSELMFGIGGLRVGHIYSLLCILRKMLEDGFELKFQRKIMSKWNSNLYSPSIKVYWDFICQSAIIFKIQPNIIIFKTHWNISILKRINMLNILWNFLPLPHELLISFLKDKTIIHICHLYTIFVFLFLTYFTLYNRI